MQPSRLWGTCVKLFLRTRGFLSSLRPPHSTRWKTRWSRSWPRGHDVHRKSRCLIVFLVCHASHVAGRGLVLTTDVEPGEVILEVPSSVLLHPGALAKQGRLTCAPRKTYSTGKSSKSTLSTHQIVAYALAQWRCTGRPNCPLSPFLYSLPTEFPTAPLTWQVGSNPEEKRLIEALSPTAQLRADKVFKGFERDWNRLIDLETKSPDVLEEIWACMRTSTPRKPLVRADLLWAWLCTNSRCVYMDLHYERHEDNFTLAPLLDMANHTPIPWLECKVRYDARGGLELLAPNHPRPEDAGRAGWRKGDEVCITYGAHANTTLLAEYGFVLPRILHSSNCHWTGNRYCDVLLDAPVGELFGEDENGSWKRELLEKEGYWAYVLPFTQRLFNTSIPNAGTPLTPSAYSAAAALHERRAACKASATGGGRRGSQVTARCRTSVDAGNTRYDCADLSSQ